MWRYYTVFFGLLVVFAATFLMMMVESEGQARLMVEAMNNAEKTRMDILEDGLSLADGYLRESKAERAAVLAEVAELKEEVRRLKR